MKKIEDTDDIIVFRFVNPIEIKTFKSDCDLKPKNKKA